MLPIKEQKIKYSPNFFPEYSCGIDIGTSNFGICFVSSGEVIGYRGSLEKFTRYQVSKENFQITAETQKKSDEIFSEYAIFTELLGLIPEFEKTFRVGIEKQVAFHNAEILRIDGIVFGFLSGRYPNIKVEYISPQTRMSESKKIMSEYPECENVKIPKKSFREQKIPGMKITGFFEPVFYKLLMEEVEDSKIDDLCDSFLYAIIGTSFSPMGCEFSKELQKKIKENKK